MLHKLKIKKEYYELVRNGMKPFEIRKNDRNYQTGDFVSFIPVNENGMIIPHNKNKYLITYVFNGGEYGLNPDYCVFGISEWIKFKEDDTVGTVRELVYLLGMEPLDNLLFCTQDGENIGLKVNDILRGNGTSRGITFLDLTLDE